MRAPRVTHQGSYGAVGPAGRRCQVPLYAFATAGLFLKKGRLSSMKERALSRSWSAGLVGPLHGDGCGGSGSVPVIHSAARGGPECLAGLEGSIKLAAVSRFVGGEGPLTTHELARAIPLHRRAGRRRHSRGGSCCDRR